MIVQVPRYEENVRGRKNEKCKIRYNIYFGVQKTNYALGTSTPNLTGRLTCRPALVLFGNLMLSLLTGSGHFVLGEAFWVKIGSGFLGHIAHGGSCSFSLHGNTL